MRIKTGNLIFALLGLALGFGIAGHGPLTEGAGEPALFPDSGSAIVESLVRSSFGISPARAADWHQRQKRRKRKEAAIRAAEEKEKERTEGRLVGTSVKELPADCPYDSIASATAGADVYSCGGVQYQRVEGKDGVRYHGSEIGLDPAAVRDARARRAKADKAKAEAEVKEKAAKRKKELPSGCAYDANASSLRGEDVYTCADGKVYRPYEEKGVTGFESVTP